MAPRLPDATSRNGAAHVAFDRTNSLGPYNVVPFVAHSHTPHDCCVRFASAVTDGRATLTARRPATAFPGPDFHRLDRASLTWRTGPRTRRAIEDDDSNRHGYDPWADGKEWMLSRRPSARNARGARCSIHARYKNSRDRCPGVPWTALRRATVRVCFTIGARQSWSRRGDKARSSGCSTRGSSRG